MNFSIKEESNYQYIDEGKGEILLLLHGLFGALSNWEGVINLFSQKYCMFAPCKDLLRAEVLALSVMDSMLGL